MKSFTGTTKALQDDNAQGVKQKKQIQMLNSV